MAYIELNPDRANKTSVMTPSRVEQDFNVAAQQFQVMQDSGEADPGHHGGLCRLLGQGSTGQSGAAISNLVEQGATTLSEINDNYRMGCQQVGSWHWHTCWKTWPASATTRCDSESR